MGKLSAFVPMIAESLGMPPTAVESYVKPLRKAQLITTGGRGTAAPDINERDCASILTAVMLGSPTHAVERLQLFGTMRNCMGPNVPLKSIFNLADDHTFLDMFSALLRYSADETLIDRITRVYVEEGVIDPSLKDEDGENTEFGHYVTISLRPTSEVAFVNLRCCCNGLHVDDYVIRYLPTYAFDEEERKTRLVSLNEDQIRTIRAGLFVEWHLSPSVIDDVGNFLRSSSNQTK